VWSILVTPYCRHHATTTACPDYRGVRISEDSGGGGGFPVDGAMRTRAVELSLAVRLRERLTQG